MARIFLHDKIATKPLWIAKARYEEKLTVQRLMVVVETQWCALNVDVL